MRTQPYPSLAGGDGRAAAARALAAREESSLAAVGAPQLLVLHQEALRFVGQAAADLESGRGDGMWILVNRAQSIIDELSAELAVAGELPARLRALFLVYKRRLVKAGMDRDPAALVDVSRLLGRLAESFAGLDASFSAPPH